MTRSADLIASPQPCRRSKGQQPLGSAEARDRYTRVVQLAQIALQAAFAATICFATAADSSSSITGTRSKSMCGFHCPA